ncbi:MAG: hypothetical protein OXE79_09655 [Acidimicrobiaceae bacterium]|nr:hypothetical protein [Acidimicrobiaceae bacterium]MCY4175137.1 hypothetical protein [Acidimicrobiaceae bacterium]MCY4280082.1 hypothetical protein [Acidimicrobiaceae bacterium]
MIRQIDEPDPIDDPETRNTTTPPEHTSGALWHPAAPQNRHAYRTNAPLKLMLH